MAITGTETAPSITTSIPGPEAKKVVRRDHRYLATTTKTSPVVARRALGAVVEDVDGNVLLDFAAGIGVVNTGHCHPAIVRAVQDQAARLIHFAGTDFYYDEQAALAEALSKRVPVKGAKVFYTNSGTEANEAAIKLARAATGRHRFLAFIGAFHGRTQGALSLTASKAIQREAFFGSMPGVAHAPFPDPFRNTWGIDGYADPEGLTARAIDHIEDMLRTVLPGDDVAALFWEPVQGEGGYIVPPRGFPRALRRLCDERGILLVADEVQTGFGRTGKWFGSEHFGVRPDIMSLAKAMGSGIPIGAAVCRRELDFKRKGMHSNTYGGNPVACAAALATLEVIEQEKLVENAARVGNHLGARLDELRDMHDAIGDSRGLGLMRAVEFVTDDGAPDAKLRDAVVEAAWKAGLVLLGCGRSAIRFIPPLMVTSEQVDGGMEVFEKALRAVKA